MGKLYQLRTGFVVGAAGGLGGDGDCVRFADDSEGGRRAQYGGVPKAFWTMMARSNSKSSTIMACGWPRSRHRNRFPTRSQSQGDA